MTTTTTEKAVELAIANNQQQNSEIPEDETKQKREEEEETDNRWSKQLDELFYIYYENQISGPYAPLDIIKKFMSNQIQREIWVKSAKDAQKKMAPKKSALYFIDGFDGTQESGIEKEEYETEDPWIKFILSPKQIESEENNRIRSKYPMLYNYLMPKIKDASISKYKTPSDAPQDITNSTFQKIKYVIGRCVEIVIGSIIGLHILPTMFIGCPLTFCWLIIAAVANDSEDEDTKSCSNKFMVLATFVSFTGLAIIPPIIVYPVLLGIVDYDEWNGEIQSWMIAYIAWGIFSLMAITAMLTEWYFEKLFVQIMNMIFWIVGVDFGSIGIDSFFGSSNPYKLCLYPALAAVLPSSIIGFLANYALEEKFELKCGLDITDQTLCFHDDGHGCCQLISSYDARDSYAFVGGLTSNILASWAVIRIIGYTMIHSSTEAGLFAKRHS